MKIYRWYDFGKIPQKLKNDKPYSYELHINFIRFTGCNNLLNRNWIMKEINILIAIISFLILAMGLIKANIKKSFVSEPLIALFLGIILGPHLLA